MFYAIVKKNKEIETKYFNTEEQLKCFVAWVDRIATTWDIIESGKI